MTANPSSAFSLYASRFLAGESPPERIFRSSPSSSPSHDPFLPSPSSSKPHLPGSPSSSSLENTPPFPGPGISGVPELHDEQTEDARSNTSVPNPYAASTSSDDDIEMDLEEVAATRHPREPSVRPPRPGWKAYQSVFPPSSSSSIGSEGPQETEMDEPLLPETRAYHTPSPLQVYHGRMGHWEREGLRKYKDPAYLALWLASILGVLVGLCFVWGPTETGPRQRPSIVPVLPLLVVLLVPAVVLPPMLLYLLSKTVRPVLVGTAILVPFSLVICGWWALGASFEQLDISDPWWGTSGLRFGAAVLWIVAGWFGWLVWTRRTRLAKTADVVEMSTKLLLSHPPLLLLTPALLVVFTFLSIPFLTMAIRLGMIGYWRQPRENTWIYQIRPYAGWLIALTVLLWIWSWSIIRGVGRVAVAGVVGQWYFHRDDPSNPVEITRAALQRATGTSLGSVCLGAGIVAISRVIGKSAAYFKRAVSSRSRLLPAPLLFISNLGPLFTMIAGVLDQINGFALVYVGITGEAFWPSTRRAVVLAGRRRGGQLLDYTLIKLLLTLSSSALGLFTATAGYLYMSHSLLNPNYAPAAALLCGTVPFLAVRAGAAILGDTADALFICHQIDAETGGQHCAEAKEAFSGGGDFTVV